MLAWFATILFLLLGLAVIDADLAMQKKQEVKALLELANHDATFAVNPALKTEGIIDLMETEAMQRFAKRMSEKGYTWSGNAFFPASARITANPLPFAYRYIDFLGWQRDYYIQLEYDGGNLRVLQEETGGTIHPTGGRIYLSIRTKTGEMLGMAPKKMIGPSLITVAYVDEPPLTPLLPGHAFPVVSIEEVKH